MIHSIQTHKSGFTIVELLIVIVVIGILAAITIVSFNNVQERARFATAKADIAAINKAILLFYAEKGYYPFPTSACTNGWCGWDQSTEPFVPGLAPAYISVLPQMPTSNASGNTYLYKSLTGENYQLMRYKSDGLSTLEKTDNPLLGTPAFTATGWGYASSGWSG